MRGTSVEDRAPASDLLQALVESAGRLVRDEVALASREIRDGFRSLRRSVLFIIASLLLAAVGVAVMVSAVVLILARYMAPWKATLVIAIVFLVGAVLTARAGLQRLDFGRMRPRQTLETLRETTHWLKGLR